MSLSHYLHSGYAHPTTRSWHEVSGLRDSNLIYPVFVTNT